MIFRISSRGRPGGPESLALPRAVQVDAGEDHGQLRRLQFDAVPSAGIRRLERAGLEPLDAGITGPSFLWRYTNSETSGYCCHESAASLAIGRDGSWG
jgi:hypothetical protein